MGTTQVELDQLYQVCGTIPGFRCEQEGFETELPAREVTWASYYIDVYEVTNEQYAAFLTKAGNQTGGGVLGMPKLMKMLASMPVASSGRRSRITPSIRSLSLRGSGQMPTARRAGVDCPLRPSGKRQPASTPKLASFALTLGATSARTLHLQTTD
jgi:hypothetical protein